MNANRRRRQKARSHTRHEHVPLSHCTVCRPLPRQGDPSLEPVKATSADLQRAQPGLRQGQGRALASSLLGQNLMRMLRTQAQPAPARVPRRSGRRSS